MRFLWVFLLFFGALVACTDTDSGSSNHDDGSDIDEETLLPYTGDEDDLFHTEEDLDEESLLPDEELEKVVVIPKNGLSIEATVDLRQWESGTFLISEQISFPAPDDGNTIKLFGEKMSVTSVSVPFDYDKHTFLFFMGSFTKGEPLSLTLSYTIKPASSMGLRIWQDSETEEIVIGPFTEPYFTPYWLVVPQSPFKTDKDNDESVAVEKVKLSVIAPDESWQVIGPGVTGIREENHWTFSMNTPMPLYALSFAASPDYLLVSAGKTSSGIEVIGAGFSREKERLEAIYPAGVATVEWMEEHIAPHEFGDKVGLVSIPEFGGGMEHVGVIYMGTDVLASYETGIFVTAHEIVHNWWGNSVRFADWPHFWVAEGFDEWTTNFNLMARLEDEQSFAARRAQYRFIGSFFCSSGEAVPLRFDEDLDFMTLGMQLQLFYYYGATFLEMVNQRLIRDFDGMTLLTLLKEWYAAKRLSSVTTEDFLAFLVEHTNDTGGYWETLFNDWVYRAPCPTLAVSNYSFTEETLSFTLTHTTPTAPDLPALPVTIVWEDGLETQSINLAAGESVVITATHTTPPQKILIDPQWFYVFSLNTTDWHGPSVSFTETPPTRYVHTPPTTMPLLPAVGW